MTSPANHAGTAPAPLRLEIRGMSCGHCVAAVRQALAELPGAQVQEVAVGAASLTLAPGTPADAALAAVRDAGYEARVAPPAP